MDSKPTKPKNRRLLIKNLISRSVFVVALFGSLLLAACTPRTNYASYWIGPRTELRSRTYRNEEQFAPALYSSDLSRHIRFYEETAPEQNATALPLVRKITFARNSYFRTSGEHYQLSEPGQAPSYYYLEGAETVIITDWNDNKYVFNEDVNWSARTPITASPTSINSPHFQRVLAQAKTISFKIRQGVFWIDAKGQKTAYELSPDDYFYSLARSELTNPYRRWSAGGSISLDEKFTKRQPDESSEYVSDSGIFSPLGNNSYLIDLYNFYPRRPPPPTGEHPGYDSKISYQDFVNIQARTITFYDHAPSDFAPSDVRLSVHFFEYLIARMLWTAAAPAAFIKTQAEALAADGHGTDDVRRFGFYQYGRTDNSTLFIGSYFPYQRTRQRAEYRLNEHYWNKELVESPTTVRRYTIERLDPDEPSEIQRKLVNAYKEGLIDYIPALGDDTTLSERRDIISYPQNWGVSHYFPQNAGHQIGAQAWNFTFFNGKSHDFYNELVTWPDYDRNRYLNDDAIRLFYGLSGTVMSANTDSYLDYFYLGDGAALRSSLVASLNWFTHVRQLASGSSVPWLSYLPPEAVLSTRGPQSQRIRDLGLNSAGIWSGPYSMNVTRADADANRFIYENTPTVRAAYRAANYDAAQNAIREIIDRNLPSSTQQATVKILLPAGRDQNDPQYEAMRRYGSMITDHFNTLYPAKLSFSLALVTGQPDDFTSQIDRDYRTQPHSLIAAVPSWSADYDGSSTFLTGQDRYLGGLFINAVLARRAATSASEHFLKLPAVRYALAYKDSLKASLAISDTDFYAVADLKPSQLASFTYGNASEGLTRHVFKRVTPQAIDLAIASANLLQFEKFTDSDKIDILRQRSDLTGWNIDILPAIGARDTVSVAIIKDWLTIPSPAARENTFLSDFMVRS